MSVQVHGHLRIIRYCYSSSAMSSPWYEIHSDVKQHKPPPTPSARPLAAPQVQQPLPTCMQPTSTCAAYRGMGKQLGPSHALPTQHLLVSSSTRQTAIAQRLSCRTVAIAHNTTFDGVHRQHNGRLSCVLQISSAGSTPQPGPTKTAPAKAHAYIIPAATKCSTSHP